jgi:toxin-antitoxin system PIN domain toxin
MNYLIDVNVWTALALAGHTHHSAANEWLKKAETDQLFFCRVTQGSFLRLLTNARIMGEHTLTPAQAWGVYDTSYKDDRVRFAPEPPGLEAAWRAATRRPRTGPNFWTDAYLSAFAAAAGFTVVTFDRGFRDQPGARVHVLP